MRRTACQELSAAFWIGQIQFRLLPNTSKLPGRTTQSIVSLFDMIVTIFLARQSPTQAERSTERKGHRSGFMSGEWGVLIRIASETCREQVGNEQSTTLRAFVGRPKRCCLYEREREQEITCMLKTSSELSDCPVMLLTSLEAWDDREDEE